VINEWPDGQIFRVSTHFYNTEAEIDRLADWVTENVLLEPNQPEAQAREGC
jgi:selenocysteine lyase/cysteine desulfurase